LKIRPKVFTLKEANEALPKIVEALKRVVIINERTKVLTTDINDLFDIWGEGVYDPKNTDHTYCYSKMTERNALLQELQYHINNIQGLGCFVKDVNQGLVDFYCEHNGNLILLCWRKDEKEILWWHKPNDGWGARRSVSELTKVGTKTDELLDSLRKM